MRRNLRTRIPAALAGATVLALGVTGCSAGGGSTGSADELEVFSFWTSGSENAALTKLFDLYTAQYPEVKITNGAVSGGAGSNGTQVLQSRIAGNDAPDVWQAFPGDGLANYVDAGLVQDLTDVYDEEGWNDVMPQSILDLVSTDGKPYAVITGAHRVNVLWTNTAVLKDLGITVDGTLSPADFTADLEAAKAAGVDGLCLGDKDIFASAQLIESYLLAELGPDGAADLYAGKTGWDDPAVATALGNYAEILDYVNADHSALTWDQAVGQFAKNQCAFTMFPDSAYGELIKGGAVDGTDFSYVPYPGTDGTFLYVADSFTVNTKLTDKTNADNWMKIIGSAEGQLEFNKLKGSTPIRTDVDTSSLGAYQQGAAESFRSDALLGSATFGHTIPSAVQQAFYDATTSFNNDRDVDAFVSAMTTATNG